MTAEFRAELAAHRLVAIVRGSDPSGCLRSLETLAGCGVRVAEVSLTSAGAIDVLARAAAALGGALRLGAGTVLSGDDARAAADAGADFVVSPALGEGIDTARSLGLPVVPGAFTPSEAAAAWRAGATAIKLFPASLVGPAYLRALRDPMPDVPVVPVGGVGIDDVDAWFSAGALALGVGGPLLGDAPSGGDQGALAGRARRWVEALQPFLQITDAGA